MTEYRLLYQIEVGPYSHISPGNWWPLQEAPETDTTLNRHILNNLERRGPSVVVDVEFRELPNAT